MTNIMDILNFVQVSELIGSSGQPSEADFKEIAAQGYSTVINLALTTSDNAIANEDDLVTGLGMSYVHIPIQWEHPTLTQFEIFSTAMQQLQEKKVWVHCALNMRVSAFLYLYTTRYLQHDEETALTRLHKVWEPNEVWQSFIAEVKTS